MVQGSAKREVMQLNDLAHLIHPMGHGWSRWSTYLFRCFGLNLALGEVDGEDEVVFSSRC